MGAVSEWQVGDLAVCVDVGDAPRNGGIGTAGTRFQLGAVYRVIEIRSHWHTGETVLLMEGQPDTAGAFRFRKIRPDKHEDCEPEFVTLLKRSKRKVGA